MTKEIYVSGKFNNDIYSIERLAQLQKLCLTSPYNDITLNFKECTFIHASVLTLIGTLPKLVESQGKHISLDFRNSSVAKYMHSSGLGRFYNKHTEPNKNAIPFRHIEDPVNASDQVDSILHMAPITLDAEAADILSSRLCEVFNNSFEHSQSELDTFCCGHWMPQKKYLTFSIYDAGIGIPTSVNTYLDKHLSDDKCLQIALMDGFSTAEHNVGFSRGLGLKDLKDFITLNNGCMKLYSGKGCYSIENGIESYHLLNHKICGTLFIMNIQADNTHIYIV